MSKNSKKTEVATYEGKTDEEDKNEDNVHEIPENEVMLKNFLTSIDLKIRTTLKPTHFEFNKAIKVFSKFAFRSIRHTRALYLHLTSSYC